MVNLPRVPHNHQPRFIPHPCPDQFEGGVGHILRFIDDNEFAGDGRTAQVSDIHRLDIVFFHKHFGRVFSLYRVSVSRVFDAGIDGAFAVELDGKVSGRIEQLHKISQFLLFIPFAKSEFRRLIVGGDGIAGIDDPLDNPLFDQFQSCL